MKLGEYINSLLGIDPEFDKWFKDNWIAWTPPRAKVKAFLDENLPSEFKDELRYYRWFKIVGEGNGQKDPTIYSLCRKAGCLLITSDKDFWSEAPRPQGGELHYFLPRGNDTSRTGNPNSSIIPDIYQIYAYDLDSAANKLDFLFTDVSDSAGALEALIGDIMQGIIGRESAFRNVSSWDNLLNGPPLVENGQSRKWGDHYASTVGKFRRLLRRMVRTMQSGIFVDSRARSESVLGDEMLKIKGGHTYVIDINHLYEHEKMFVFGDLLKTIYSLKAEPPEDRTEPVPEKVIFFVDELNKYAPAGAKTSSLTEQVLDIAERGRSLGVILISAQQFMSAVHPRVTGNCATKIIGRSGSAEVLQPDYRFLDNEIKSNVTRLAKGELLLSHAVYRQPVKVIFPKPAFKQQES